MGSKNPFQPTREAKIKKTDNINHRVGMEPLELSCTLSCTLHPTARSWALVLKRTFTVTMRAGQQPCLIDEHNWRVLIELWLRVWALKLDSQVDRKYLWAFRVLVWSSTDTFHRTHSLLLQILLSTYYVSAQRLWSCYCYDCNISRWTYGTFLTQPACLVFCHLLYRSPRVPSPWEQEMSQTKAH